MTKAEIRELAMFQWGYRCAYPGCAVRETPLEAHHALLEDSKRNQRKYPLLTNSLLNIRPLCHFCHERHRNYWNISDHHADCIEKYLQGLKNGKN